MTFIKETLPGPEVLKLEFILKLKIKRNECHSLRFILSLRLYSSFITSGPGVSVLR